jgi:hypothetical protein
LKSNNIFKYGLVIAETKIKLAVAPVTYLLAAILFYGTQTSRKLTKCRAARLNSYTSIEKQKKIMPVEMQVRYTDLLFFKKCETGDIDCDVRERLDPRCATDCTHQDLLQAAPARTMGLAQQAFAFRHVEQFCPIGS